MLALHSWISWMFFKILFSFIFFTKEIFFLNSIKMFNVLSIDMLKSIIFINKQWIIYNLLLYSFNLLSKVSNNVSIVISMCVMVIIGMPFIFYQYYFGLHKYDS